METVQPLRSWTFSVNGMHCAGCIRKIQRAGAEVEGLSDLKIDFSNKTVKAQTAADFDPQIFVRKIGDLGFGIRLLPEIEKSTGKANSFLARVGIAGACAGNIMLISVAGYAGADQSELAGLLRGLSSVFFLPVLFYSAWPFFENSLSALRHRQISIDIPIAFAILGGSLLSFFNFFRGSSELYFDSISMFVFFLLASRYLIFQIQNRHLQPVSLEDIYTQPLVTLLSNQQETKVEVSRLKPGDVIKVPRGEFVPADGRLVSPEVEVNNAFFNGEAFPRRLLAQESVFAGAKVVSSSALIEVSQAPDRSRLADLVKQLNKALVTKTPITSLTDKGAHYLTLGVLMTAAVFFSIYAFSDWQEGLNRVLALLVVACPCGLAIATPLAQSLSVKAALKKAVLVKKAEALEKLRQCTVAIFDKTGTLTSGQLEVSHWHPRRPNAEESGLIAQLEKSSEHPIAKALLRNISTEDPSLPVENIEEKIGHGVRGYFDGSLYEIKSVTDENYRGIGFYKDGQLVITAVLRDQILSQAPATLAALRQRGLENYLLSGDHDEIARAVGEKLGFAADHIIGNASPEKKTDSVRSFPRAVYLGDGVNDALAMSEAHVSVSMHSAADATFRASDIHLLDGDISVVPEIFDLSQRTFTTIKHNVILSAAYNSVFAVAALAGWINPLVAVILMPVSSLTVAGYTLWRIRP